MTTHLMRSQWTQTLQPKMDRNALGDSNVWQLRFLGIKRQVMKALY